MFHNISDSECGHCRPDCESTIYTTSVTSSPLRQCSPTNMPSSFLCNYFNSDLPHPKRWANKVLAEAPHFAPDYIFKQVP